MKRYLIVYIDKDGEFRLLALMAVSFQAALSAFQSKLVVKKHGEPAELEIQEIYSITIAR